MARIRSIKPSIWTDERFIGLGRDARLLFLGMISHADDSGRLVASGAALIGAIYPHDDIRPRQVEKWRDEIAAAGLITIYRAGRGTYSHLHGWSKHQRIQKSQPSTLPPPPAPDRVHDQSRTESRNQSRNQSRTDSSTEVERDKERETEVERESSGDESQSRTADDTDQSQGRALTRPTAALTLLDRNGPWVPKIRAQLAVEVDELLTAEVDPPAIERALATWRTRKAGPGLLAHLVQDELTPAQQQDPRFAGLLADARSSA